MKKLLLLSFAVVVFLGSLSPPAMAGIGTSPFPPLINKLHSIENVLAAINANMIVVVDSIPVSGGGYEESFFNLCSSISFRLAVQSVRVQTILDALPDNVPAPDVFWTALHNVGDMALNIADFAAVPPDPCSPEIRQAFLEVELAAMEIVRTIRPWPS